MEVNRGQFGSTSDGTSVIGASTGAFLNDSSGVHFQRQDADAIPEAALEDFLELEEFRRNIREFDADWPQVRLCALLTAGTTFTI